jgi:hypothetical protein
MSPIRRQRRRHEAYILQGELRKIKPPNFNGENMKGKEVRKPCGGINLRKPSILIRK